MRMMVRCTVTMHGDSDPELLNELWFTKGKSYVCYDDEDGDLRVVDEYGTDWYAAGRGEFGVYLLGVEAEFVKI